MLPSGGRINCTSLMRFRAHQTLSEWGSIARKHKSKEGTSGLSWLPAPRSEGACRPNLGNSLRIKHPTPVCAENMKFDCQQHINCRKTRVWDFRASDCSHQLFGIHRRLVTSQCKQSCELMRYLRWRSSLGEPFVVTVLQIDCGDCFVFFRLNWLQVGLQ